MGICLVLDSKIVMSYIVNCPLRHYIKKQFLGSDSEQLIIVCPEQLSNQGPEKGKKKFSRQKRKELIGHETFFPLENCKRKEWNGQQNDTVHLGKPDKRP